MAQLRLLPPDQFDFRNPDDWPRWKRRFQQFREASSLTEDSAKKQVNTLLYCLGEEAEAVLSSTTITAEERDVYDTVVSKFDSFFQVRRNVIFERARFNKRDQLPGETVEQYIMELYKLVEYCSYGELKDEMIRDRLVVGILDSALSQRLQLDATLTLEKAKKLVRQREAVGEQNQLLRETEPSTRPSTSVDELQPRRYDRRRPQQRNSGPRRVTFTPQTQSKTCQRCGKGQHSREECPAKDAECHRCHKKGHFNAMCRTKNVAQIVSTNEMDEAFLDTVSDGQKASTWMTHIEVNGTSIPFKMDTGAEVTAISEETYSILEKPHLTAASKVLYGPSRTQLKVIGMFNATLAHRGKMATQSIFVVGGLKKNLLGLPSITALQLAARLDATATDYTESILERYPTVFQGLGNFGEEYKIELKPDATPYSLMAPRNIPIPLRPKVKEELTRMESLGVISPVDQPTPWCAGMVVVPKKEGAIRICVDLKPLNESVLREVHPLPRVDDTLAQLTGAKIFSKLDANSGFWQIPLAPESKPLTTFITPFGRFCFNKLPFGISSAPEHFQKRMSNILAGLEGVLCLIDDVLIYGKDTEEHDERLLAVLERIKAAGVTLNRNKCEFRKTQLKFLGHIIDQDGVRPDPEKTSAIREMKAPSNIPELRRLMGMANQLGKFSCKLAEISQPLRVLLSKKNAWTWGEAQETAFTKLKEELSQPTVLALYDPQAPTKVSADASSYGLGAVLLQEKNSTWKPIAYASRAMTETEQRYAQIEKEALATTWACEKFSSYILGMKVHIETDHKSLVPLLGTKDLDRLPPRVLRFRLRLARFQYSISHVPGKDLYTADTLSRAPGGMTANDGRLQDEAEDLLELCIAHLPASNTTVEEYKREQTADPICSTVIKYCQREWPDKNKVASELKPYWKVRGNLTVTKGSLLMYDRRIVVPKALQRQTLQKIHTGHQGIQRCRLRAQSSVWWPGISQIIANMVQQCNTCAKHRSPRCEPMIPTPLPDYPWQMVSSDLFQLNGAHYLLVVDYFSRYPEAIKLRSTTSQHVIEALKNIFAHHGIPETVFSDNGPQYASREFVAFAKAYNFDHRTSSPHYAQSNGHAERAVKTVKKLLQEADDPHLVLLSYRATPFPWCQLSPAELLMGRPLRTNLHTDPVKLCPDWKYLSRFRQQNQEYKAKQKENFDARHRAQTLPQLPDDTDVWITTGTGPVRGRVVSSTAAPRSYIVNTPTGDVRRNRSHLNPVPQSDGTTAPESTSIRTSPIMTRTRTGATIQPPNRL